MVHTAFDKLPITATRQNYPVGKKAQHSIGGLPFISLYAHDYAMSAKPEAVQCVKIFHNTSPQGIKMNVAYQLFKVRVFLAEN